MLLSSWWRSCVLASLVLVGLASVSRATATPQAFCRLRDPSKSISELYPESNSFRSFVRTIGSGVRERVSNELPFELHFNELGRHTLYAVFEDEFPVGYVHVRSERSRWGLVEIAWAIDSDMRIVGFDFQRCRDKHKSLLLRKDFQSQLIGKGLPQLLTMLDERGEALRPGALIVPEEVRDLAVATLRCALKTLVVTDAAWGSDIAPLQARVRAAGLDPVPAELHACSELYDEGALERLRTLGLDGAEWVRRDGLLAYRLVNKDRENSGHLARVPWRYLQDKEARLWVYLDASGVPQRVEAEGGWPDPKMEPLFRESLRELSRSEEACESAVDLLLLELRTLFDEQAD